MLLHKQKLPVTRFYIPWRPIDLMQLVGDNFIYLLPVHFIRPMADLVDTFFKIFFYLLEAIVQK